MYESIFFPITKRLVWKEESMRENIDYYRDAFKNSPYPISGKSFCQKQPLAQRGSTPQFRHFYLGDIPLPLGEESRQIVLEGLPSIFTTDHKAPSDKTDETSGARSLWLVYQ